ncbi:MAG: SBBP repeat-containing protein, partial [Pseudomonadota bacterium]
LWPGIDLDYTPGDGILQSTYQLAPGARPESIELDYNIPLAITRDGQLQLHFGHGILTESAPLAWQTIGGEQHPVVIAFEPRGEKRLGFRLGVYDATQPLTIDPNLSWTTFAGSTSNDYGTGVAVDFSNDVYVAGTSSATWGTPVKAHAGGDDIVVAKFNGTTGALIWNSFLGSATTDKAGGIAVDGAKDVYVTGSSDATWGAPIKPHAGGNDILVAKLNPTGALLWHTFLGGTGTDNGNRIAIDGAGKVYVAGTSDSTWGAPVRAHAGGQDIAVASLDTATGALSWNTFLGAPDNDLGFGIAAGGGQVFVSGDSSSNWGSPVNAHSVDAAGSPNPDIVVARLDAATGALGWNTFMGSLAIDHGNGLALDSSNHAYVTGSSSATWGSPINPHAGGDDIVVASLDVNGRLLWSSFLGSAVSTGSDIGYGIAVSGGTVYITGISDSTWGAPVNPHAGNSDIFLAELDSTSGGLWANTFQGSAGADSARDIAVDANGGIRIAGSSDTTWGTPINAYAGLNDIVVANFNVPTLQSQTITNFTADVTTSPATLSATATSGLAITFGSTTPTICTVAGNLVSFLAAGNCIVTADQAGNITTLPAPQVTLTIPISAKTTQTISGFAANPTSAVIGGTSTLSATASSGLAVTFGSTTPTICTVAGNLVSFLAAGN